MGIFIVAILIGLIPAAIAKSSHSRMIVVHSSYKFSVGDTMKATAQTLDLSTLADTALREVADFYQFVMQRYGLVQKKQAVAKNKLPAEFY